MSSRTRRRKAEQQAASQSAPPASKFDLIVYARDGFPFGDCIESFPQGDLGAIKIVVNNGVEIGAEAMGHQAKVVRGDRTTGRMTAASSGNSGFLVFVDADCQLLEPSMINIALAHLSSGAGVVGGLLVDDRDKVLSAGYAFSTTGRPYYRFNGWSPDHPKVQRMRDDIQAVPFGFLATRRDIFRRVGFRTEFHELAYTEADYCCRAREIARVIYEPAIRVRTSGQLIASRDIEASVQLLLASARPQYDEFALL